MNGQQFIAQIRNLIAQDDLPEALQQLGSLLENSPKLDEAILQSARFQDIHKQIRLGVVSFEDVNLTKNQTRLGLLDLLREIETQGAKPVIKKELDQAVIKIINSKNVVVGSNISARGDVHIGDRTESKTSRGLRLFLFLFVSILAIGDALFWYQYQEMQRPLNLKISIENLTPNPALPEPSGVLTLTYGGKPEQKEQVSTEANFEKIPANFKKEKFRLQFAAEGFVKIDTSFT